MENLTWYKIEALCPQVVAANVIYPRLMISHPFPEPNSFPPTKGHKDPVSQ